MSKRPVEDDETEQSLKNGQRSATTYNGNVAEGEEFEDEFEDEFESDEEIFEAGVDGRPDAEREAEEKGMWLCW
jgi:ribosome assembly protein RRB1